MVEKGQELRINYSPKGNTLLFRQYGFTTPENPLNIVALNLSLEMNDPHLLYKQQVLSQIGLDSPYPNNFDTIYASKTSISGGVFSFLRLKHLVPTQDQVKNLWIPPLSAVISSENEKLVFEDLAKMVTAGLARFGQWSGEQLPDSSGQQDQQHGYRVAKDEYEIWQKLKLFVERSTKFKSEL